MRLVAAALLSAASLVLAVGSVRSAAANYESFANNAAATPTPAAPAPAAPSPLTPSERAGVENVVIVAYRELLDRDPTKTEFSADVRAVSTGALTVDQLRARLRTTDEAGRIANVQANDLEPGLPRAIVERDVTERLAALYARLKGRAMKPEVALLLYDLYARMDYSEARLGAALMDPRWDAFEERALREPGLTREKLYAMYDAVLTEPVGPQRPLDYARLAAQAQAEAAAAEEEKEKRTGAWAKFKYMFDVHRRPQATAQ